MASTRTPEALVVPRGVPVRTRVRAHGARRAAVAILLGLLGVAACKDAPTDPLIGLVAGESEGALAVGVALPDPTRLAPGEGLSLEGTRALQAWQGSWSMEPDAGHAAREAAYGDLAQALAPTVTAEGVEDALARLTDGVERARSIDPEGLPDRIKVRIREAAGLRAAAVAAWSRGDARRAVEQMLRGGDALREVGPEAVARTLQREVEEAFGRVSEGGPYSDKDMERLTRLVHGGREALAEGSWVLAIRRAYYARALLHGND